MQWLSWQSVRLEIKGLLVLASHGEVTVLEQDTHLMLSTGSTQEDRSRHDEKLVTGTVRIKPKMVRYFIYIEPHQSYTVLCP